MVGKGEGPNDKTLSTSRWCCGGAIIETLGEDLRINLPGIRPHSTRGSNPGLWKEGEEEGREDKEDEKGKEPYRVKKSPFCLKQRWT